MNCTSTLLGVANTLTWPGAFALVGVAIAAAFAIAAIFWSIR